MMQKPMLGLALVALVSFPAMAVAGPIERACLNSERQAASRSLCNCIQRVADQTLRGADQRRASKFFRNPDEAHEVWMSKRDADDAFWERYKAFGATAAASCAG